MLRLPDGVKQITSWSVLTSPDEGSALLTAGGMSGARGAPGARDLSC